MGWLIAALGTGLAIGGTAAIYFGAPYIQIEWGYSEVIAGTTALSAGILAVALAAILFALRDLKGLASAARLARADASLPPAAPVRIDAPVAPPAPAAAPVPPPTVEARGEAAAPDDEPALFRSTPEAAVPAADPAPTVVGRYEANGAHYVLFSDGTIEVETESGTHRYASMQDLRAHIEQRSDG